QTLCAFTCRRRMKPYPAVSKTALVALKTALTVGKSVSANTIRCLAAGSGYVDGDVARRGGQGCRNSPVYVPDGRSTQNVWSDRCRPAPHGRPRLRLVKGLATI